VTKAQQPSPELTQLRETANALYRSGDYALALQKAEQVLPLVIRQFGPEHEQTLIQYTSLGMIAEKAGNLPAAQRYHAESVRIREKVYGPESAGVAQALENLGAIYVKMGQPDTAEPIFNACSRFARTWSAATTRSPRADIPTWVMSASHVATGRRRSLPIAKRSA
jgi:tetratricopeptide (TPR) repeat protein